jgi:environmental stress-induced protein Ves
MRLIRFADLPRLPWKNGGGATVELAVDPPGAGFDGFGWRVSAAEIRESGPFSRFDGVDRTLALLDGEGLALDFGDRTLEASREGEPVAFRGEEPVIGRPLGGFVRDLNVMTRRAVWRAEVASRTFEPEAAFPTGAEVRMFVARSACAIDVSGRLVAPGPRDAIILDAGEVATAAGTAPARGLMIMLTRVGAER